MLHAVAACSVTLTEWLCIDISSGFVPSGFIQWKAPAIERPFLGGAEMVEWPKALNFLKRRSVPGSNPQNVHSINM